MGKEINNSLATILGQEEIKQIVINKLQIRERSLKEIFKDWELCKRIVNEDIIEIKEAAKKFNIPIGTVKNLIEKRVLDCIRNGEEAKGRKTFIFEKDIANLPYDIYTYQYGFWLLVSKLQKLLNLFYNRLDKRSADIAKMYFEELKSIKEISDKWSISTTLVNQILKKLTKKFSRYINILQALQKDND